MRLASLFSGGKDSVFSMYKAIDQDHEIVCLITIISKNPESYMYHYPNIGLTKLQAEALGIPMLQRTTEGVKEKELKDLELAIKDAIEQYLIDGVVSGAIYSNYQRRRIDGICQRLGIASISPLWKLKPKEMLEDMVGTGFRLIMSAVAAGGLGQEWLGKEITIDAIQELSKLHETCYVCTGGEGGEFETLVIDCPMFKKRLKILEVEPHWDGMAGWYEIKRAALVEK
jgi:ABC transporter with metal-binding/Fe-S-binding domain ATP-binding protein